MRPGTGRAVAAPARLAGLLLTAAVLGGCAAGPPVRYHTLVAVAAATELRRYDGPALQVGVVLLPPAFDRQELVSEVAAGQFEIAELDHWAAALPRLARQALSEDLALRLPPGRLVFPGAPRPASCADLTVDVLAFKVSGGSATAWLSWTIRPVPAADAGASTAAAPARGAQLNLQTRAGTGPSATARALSDLLGQLADHITAELAAGAR